jgi:protein-S-isoprenylcysteine O-methyltransferase Ste14
LKAGPRHERERSQKIIVSFVLLAFFASIVVPALDHRYAWSPVAPGVSILGDVVIVLSFLFIFWGMRVNSFAAANIRVEKDQSVIDTGPYAHVRHPMYAGVIWLFVGMPLARLGSLEEATGRCWPVSQHLPVVGTSEFGRAATAGRRRTVGAARSTPPLRSPPGAQWPAPERWE